MSSRTIPLGLILAFLLAALPVTAARASTAPADSTAPVSADSTVVAPAPEPAPPPADTKASESKSESKDEAAKEEAKVASKAKKAEEAKAAREAKKAKDAAKKAAKKSAKKTEAPAATKGTVTPVEATAPGTMPVKPATAPQRVQVQHILIGFTGSVPGKMISRNKDEAKKLAYEILDRARKGEDFNELVAKYTDDSPPGIYGMVEKGLQPGPGEYTRDGMVAAFGNVGFNISPGNIGIADYDSQASPFGWHVIKRLK